MSKMRSLFETYSVHHDPFLEFIHTSMFICIYYTKYNILASAEFWLE